MLSIATQNENLFRHLKQQIAFIDIAAVKPHPKNPNKHSAEQIARLVKLYEYQGVRWPVIVSTLSNCVVAGCGRLEALNKIGATQVPVIYQEFTDDAQEYAFMVSDNVLAEWAELDMAAINVEFVDFGPGFDVEHFGFKDFKLEPADKVTKEVTYTEGFKLEVECENETDQERLYSELTKRGLKVKVLNL